MKASYRDDKEAGAGRGYLIFSDALLPDGPWLAALQRPSTQEYFSGVRGQWVGEEVFFPLDGEILEGGSGRFAVGPDFVDSLDQRETYLVLLKGADGAPLSARLKVSGVTYSPVESLDNTARRGAGKREPEPTLRPSAPKPEPRPPLNKPESAKVEEKPAPAPAADETLPPPARPRERGFLIPLLALLGLLVACVAGYFLYDKFSGEEDAKMPAPVAEKPAPAAEKPKPDARGVVRRVDEFFSAKDRTPQKAMELAQTLSPSTPADQDALYRLYNYAGERGEPSALLVYGACFDPAKPRWGSIGKDAVVAYGIYEKAKQSGSAGADEALNSMLKWLDQASIRGDAAATGWLRQIKQQ